MNVAWLLRTCASTAKPASGRLTRSWQIRESKQVIYRTYSQSHQATSTQHGPAPRVAIIGSGPAGFYTARKLMREVIGTKIDMYERLPVPFGLVRFGVAPDHPEVKNCQDEFEQVASSPDFNFIGNVQLGPDLPLPIIARNYDAIVFSYGASKDRNIGLEGEDKPHIYSARAFVGWYNGLPEYRDLNPNLTSGDTAIIVGQGNVALDVARILLNKIETLQKTDLTEYAIKALESSQIKHVHVVGRRGPMQAAFTIKEVREMIQLEDVNFKPIPSHLFPPDLKALPRPKRRILELLQKGKPHNPNASKSWSLDFLLAPKSLLWSEQNPDTLTGVTFAQTELADIADPASNVSSTEKQTTIPASTLFRSIGYRAEAIPGMDLIGASFDERSGTFYHDGYGRVASESKSPASLYCAGWVKRGPTGVIANTMTDAFQTAEAIAQDWRKIVASETVAEKKGGWEIVKKEAEQKGNKLDHVVSWDGWHQIDAKEKEIGSDRGKPREKFGTIEEMIEQVKQ